MHGDDDDDDGNPGPFVGAGDIAGDDKDFGQMKASADARDRNEAADDARAAIQARRGKAPPGDDAPAPPPPAAHDGPDPDNQPLKPGQNKR